MHHINPGLSRVLLIIALHASFCSSYAFASGRVVTILMRDSSSVEGELIAVHDSALIICRELSMSERRLEMHPDSLSIVRIGKILRLHVAGHHNALIGAGIGAASGLIIGSIAAANTPEPAGTVGTNRMDYRALGTIGGTLLGLLGGIIVGGMIESGARDIEILDHSELVALSLKARYQRDEPDFIKRRGAQ
jgi:hypothetical protein